MLSRKVIGGGDISYSLEDAVGRGSFADVFKGKSNQFGTVALKRIHQKHLKKTSNRKLLESEIGILQQLDHPNIVRLYGAVEDADFFYLVMEYCDGGDLATYISHNAPLPEPSIAQVSSQLASAISYLTDRNIIHRDLKPQNILLSARGGATFPTLKLADFGFARHLVEDLAATFCGSPLYMAPEVLRGDKYTGAADLWSVGVILYQCATGRTPYHATTIPALKDVLRRAEPATLPSSASPALRALVAGLLQMDPAQRMTHAQFFTHVFHAAAGAEDTVVSMYSSGIASPVVASVHSEGGAPSRTGSRGGPTGSVTEQSFIVVDKQQVELNTMVDELQRRKGARGHAWAALAQRLADLTGRAWPGDKAPAASEEETQSLLSLISDVVTPARAVMDVAAARLEQRTPSLPGAADVAARVPVDRVEALMLYSRALATLRAGMDRVRTGLSTMAGVPGMRVAEALQTFRKVFDECLERVERLHALLPPDLAAAQAEVRSEEEIIYEHAMRLCRDAAAQEAVSMFEASQVLYTRALVLLHILLAVAQGRDRQVLAGFVQLASERKAAVQTQALEMARAARDTAVRTSGTVGSQPSPLGFPTTPSGQRGAFAISVTPGPTQSSSMATTPSPMAAPYTVHIMQTPPERIPSGGVQPQQQMGSDPRIGAVIPASPMDISPQGVRDGSAQSALSPGSGAMFCGTCGVGMTTSQNFCVKCGARRGTSPPAVRAQMPVQGASGAAGMQSGMGLSRPAGMEQAPRSTQAEDLEVLRERLKGRLSTLPGVGVTGAS